MWSERVAVTISTGTPMDVAHHRIGEIFPAGTLKAMMEDAGRTENDLARLGLLPKR